MMAPSGASRYANPAPCVGCTPLAFASAICDFVSPNDPPTPGHVSLLTNTDPPSSVVYSGSSFTPRSRYSALFFCTSTTCHPKCQIAVCGAVGGGVFTLVNNT